MERNGEAESPSPPQAAAVASSPSKSPPSSIGGQKTKKSAMEQPPSPQETSLLKKLDSDSEEDDEEDSGVNTNSSLCLLVTHIFSLFVQTKNMQELFLPPPKVRRVPAPRAAARACSARMLPPWALGLSILAPSWATCTSATSST
jgi:hypothetical protein